MGRFHRLVCCLAAVALAAALVGCGDDNETTVTETETVLQKPLTTATDPASEIDLAQSTLAAIVDRDRNDPDYHSTGFRSDPTISPAFLSAIDVIEQQNEAQGFPGLDFDPILCAQNIPRGVSYTASMPEPGGVAVVATYEYGGGKPVKVRYSMVLDGDTWKLNGTDCVEQAVGGQE